jgi:hypothetical protein
LILNWSLVSCCKAQFSDPDPLYLWLEQALQTITCGPMDGRKDYHKQKCDGSGSENCALQQDTNDQF